MLYGSKTVEHFFKENLSERHIALLLTLILCANRGNIILLLNIGPETQNTWELTVGKMEKFSGSAELQLNVVNLFISAYKHLFINIYCILCNGKNRVSIQHQLFFSYPQHTVLTNNLYKSIILWIVFCERRRKQKIILRKQLIKINRYNHK